MWFVLVVGDFGYFDFCFYDFGYFGNFGCFLYLE